MCQFMTVFSLLLFHLFYVQKQSLEPSVHAQHQIHLLTETSTSKRCQNVTSQMCQTLQIPEHGVLLEVCINVELGLFGFLF